MQYVKRYLFQPLDSIAQNGLPSDAFRVPMPEPFTPQDIVTHTDKLSALATTLQLCWRAGWRWPLGR